MINALIEYTHRCSIEIRNVINDAESSGRYWSKWVDKVWDENCTHTMNLNFSFSFELTYINQNVFVIWDGNSNDNKWKVMYYEDRPRDTVYITNIVLI